MYERFQISEKSDTTAGHDAYAEVATVSRKLTTEMLVRMIESAADYHDWSLSESDGARLVKLIKHKQRIICSTFAFQLNRHFADFKAADGAQTQDDS